MSFFIKLFPACIALLLTGCGTVVHERARLEGDAVNNPTLGRGVAYRLPAGYARLNPWAPVPPKPENAPFEDYLRNVVAHHDEAAGRHAFREALLFRSDDRYIVAFHFSLNLPDTFRNVPPQNRARLLTQIANQTYLFFDPPQHDFDFDFIDRHGRTLISYAPFHPQVADGKADGWRGIGYSVVGDATDLVHVFVFSRTEDASAAQTDLDWLLSHFHYGASAILASR